MFLQVKDEATTSMKTKTETTITTTVATTKMNGVRTQNAIYKQTNVSLLEVFVVCFTLGLLFAIEIWSLFHSLRHSLLIWYCIFLECYFISEFSSSCLYQPSTVTSKSFLIYGVKGNGLFWFMQGLTVIEYLLTSSLSMWVPYWVSKLVSLVGTLCICIGLFIRHAAMKQCGDSFSHYIATKKLSHHKLKQDGIYSVLRHPSYFGFWLFAIGIQLLLNNYVNFIVDIIVLHMFFKKRVAYEEYMLIQFYGEAYRRYQNRVGVYIPFIS